MTTVRPAAAPTATTAGAAVGPAVTAGGVAGGPAVTAGGVAGGPAVTAGGVAGGPAVTAGGVAVGAARIVGLSLGHATLAEADHWIHALRPAPVLACTHLVAVPYPHVAISLLTTLPITTVPELAEAATAAAGGRAGRAVRFPGAERLTGSLTVSEILQRSAIARVEVLGGGTADPGTVVDTGDFVRPQFRGGELVLVTTPAAGDRLVPFESRTPTPCCADH